jgi:hypothetical protein
MADTIIRTQTRLSRMRFARSQRVKAQASDLSRYPQLAFNQGISEHILCDCLHGHGIRIERRTTLEALKKIEMLQLRKALILCKSISGVTPTKVLV